MMTYFTSSGRPDQFGQFELIDGRLVLRAGTLKDGEGVRFDHVCVDSASSARMTFHDAKTEPPKSIDEALQQKFAQLAKGLDISVKQMLSGMDQAKIQEIAAETAAEFIAAHASKGVVAQFATDAASDPELNYRLAAARAKHDMARRPFTAADAAAVVAKVSAARMASTYQTDAAASEAERARSAYRGALAASKHLAANAWRR